MTFLQCLLRSCFNIRSPSNNDDNDEDDQNITGESILAPRPLSFNRAERDFGTVNSTASSYRPPDTLDRSRQVAGGACNEYEQRQPLNPLAAPAVEGETTLATEDSFVGSPTNLGSTDRRNIRNNETNQISEFFGRFRRGISLNPMGNRRPPTRDDGVNVDTQNMMRKIALILSTNNKDTKPSPSTPPLTPLRVARDFTQCTSCDDVVPSLAHYEEVVLPGSNLQKQMAESLRAQGYGAESEEDECVVCMEGFDATNPRMPTRCGCGENQTYFHLPCLYQWVELRREGGARSGECPTCRELLQWDEF